MPSFLKSALLLFNMFLSTMIFANGMIVSYFLFFFLPKKTRQRIAHHLAIYWGKFIIIATPGWSVQVKGNTKLDPSKRYVFVANHESASDIFVMYFTNLQFRWLSKDSVFKIPFIGTAMYCAGYIPIVRGSSKSHAQALSRSKQTVLDNIPMLYFPEGTRSKTGELRQFKIGAFKLAQETNAEIVPIALTGTKELLKKGSMTPGKAKVTVNILEPVTCEEAESLDQWAARTREIISAYR